MNKNKLISAIFDTRCTGCSACYNACPVEAIQMRADERGFYKPFIDENKCINCKLCDHICPIIHYEPAQNFGKKLYAVWADEEERLSSSSGGMFAVLAKYVLEQRGAVFGARFGRDFRVYHDRCDEVEQLEPLKKSKYVQSYVGKAYANAKEALAMGKKVLFVGTPCQIAGLRAFLQNKTDTTGLYCVDLVCYQAPPYKVFKKYLDDNFGPELEEFSFRLKAKNLYHCIFYSYKLKGKEKQEVFLTSPYFNGFFNNLYLSEACANCAFQEESRVGDITLGDFWGIENHDATWNDGKGTSMVFTNNEKGAALFEAVRSKLKRVQNVPFGWIRSGQKNAKNAHPYRDYFYDLVNQGIFFNKAVELSLQGKKYDIGMVCVQVYQNYGSAFTNYALYNVLKDHGKEVLIITQPMSSEIKPNTPFNFRFYRYDRGDCAKFYANQEEMKKLNKICKKFLVGSDQLFNYEIYRKIDGFIKLKWVDDAHEKAVYAGSFGLDHLLGSAEEQNSLKEAVNRFKAFSVREQSAVGLMKSKFGYDASFVLDPVFLCDKKHYLDIIQPYIEAKNSLFAYILDPDKQKEKIIKAIQQQKKGNSFIVSDMWRSAQNIENLWDLDTAVRISNEEWLGRLYSSEFVITDSFHGLCFALIFNKEFIVLENIARGAERFRSILQLFGLSDRLISKDASPENVIKRINKPIDFDKVNRLIGEYKDVSLKWLESVI